MNIRPSDSVGRRAGFTLIELLVVIGMIAILVAAMTSAIASAMRSAKVAKATTEIKEMTNAILAYENYTIDHTLAAHAMNEVEASDSTLSFILGKENSGSGSGRIPILYNAAVSADGRIRDPWGTPYRVSVAAASVQIKDTVANGSLETAVFFPNYYRIGAADREDNQ